MYLIFIHKNPILIKPHQHILKTLPFRLTLHLLKSIQQTNQCSYPIIMRHQSLIIWISQNLNDLDHWLDIVAMESKCVLAGGHVQETALCAEPDGDVGVELGSHELSLTAEGGE